MAVNNMDACFTVGDWRVEPDALRIVRGEDEIKLEPKVMQVLVQLAHNHDRVVTRQQLESTVWQDVIVGYDSLGSTIIKLRKAFNDDPRNPAVIQTIPKKGYRLIAPVRFVDNAGDITADRGGSVTVAVKKRNTIRPLPMLAVVILFVAGIVLALGQWFDKPVSTKSNGVPGLAVLPFKNLSDDVQQDYFSDGITSDLITDLSNIDSIAVIARNSVFTYKNTDIDVRQIRKELGVDYVIEGSVRKAGNKVRISASLINAKNGVNIWADRFDAEFKDVFSIQDRVVEKIISSLEVKLTGREKQRIETVYTNSIKAYDYFLKGWQYFWRYTKEDNDQARGYYLKAIELDDNFARAYANIAVTYAFDYMNGWGDNPEQTLKQANYYIDKAVALDGSLPQVFWAVGIVNTYSRNYEIAIQAAEKAIAQSPNFADGHGLLATILNYTGKPKLAKPIMHKAMRLNPRPPFIYKMILGQIHFNLREYKKAEKYFIQAIERNPTAQEVRLWLASTYAYLGKQEDASWELEQIRNTGASISAEYLEQFIPLKDPVLRKHLLDGLIKAGLTATVEGG